MLELEVFVSESLSPDWSASSSISSSKVTTLDHEVGNNSVEFTSLEGKFKSIDLLVSLTESNKILNGFGYSITEHVDNNIPGTCSANIDGEGDCVSGCFLNKLSKYSFESTRDECQYQDEG